MLTWAAEMGVPITIGSDAHAPEHVACQWSEARQLLLETGTRTVQRFTGRRREAIPLGG
jgi:histidinol-phosphatase (PHP family)